MSGACEGVARAGRRNRWWRHIGRGSLKRFALAQRALKQDASNGPWPDEAGRDRIAEGRSLVAGLDVEPEVEQIHDCRRHAEI